MSREVLTPPFDRVVIKRAVEERMSAGEHGARVHIPDAHMMKPTRGTVLAVGKGVVTESGTIVPLPWKPGDIVMFTRFSVVEVELNNEILVVVKAGEILGTVVPE